ncbi:MAG: PLP-dependent aminotransferase family protein [Pseudomonadota bacterium]
MTETPAPPDWDALYAPRMRGVAASDIRERMKLLASRRIIHLGGGLPDPAIFPYAEIKAAADTILGDRARARTALQYAPSEGHAPLRAWIAEQLTQAGAPCGIDNIVITNGSQQAIDLVAKLFVAPGDPVMVEVPSFIGALRAFDAYEPTYVAVPEGEALDASLEHAKFAYVGTEFRNPTGTSLLREDRERLVARARAAGMPVLEDACYEHLRYDGEALPSLFVVGARQSGGVEASPVLQTGTFSKTVAPSLRVGWIAGPAAVVRKLVLLKQAADLATSALNQMMLLEIAETRLEALTAHARTVYRERRDAMLAGLAAHMPPGTQWTRPEGGLYIWMTLPDGVDGDVFARRALEECDTSVISGTSFHPVLANGAQMPRNRVRLSFSYIGSDAAGEGIRRLGVLAYAMRGDREAA